ncbi:MAG: sensor domain-containing diguanylate cyclase [Xanthobacteraceae bacterium]
MAIAPQSHSTAPQAKPSLSIRARLVILALLAVVPLMVDRVRLLEASRTERIDDAAAEVLEIARRGADGQREIITNARAITQMMARAYVATLARGESCNFYLADIASSMPWLNGMSIVGENGLVICSSAPKAIGVDLSDRAHYRAAMATGEFVISNYLIGRINRRPAFVAVFPTQAIDPSTKAAVISSVDLQWVSKLIGSMQRKPGSSAMLVDGSGTLLATDSALNAKLGQRIGESKLVKSLGDRDEGIVRTEGLDGVRRIFGFVRVPSSDARLIIGLNESEVLQRVDRELLLGYLQLTFFGLLVLMIAWFGGERLIVDPIRSLARTAERFGRGDLRARVPRQAWAKEFMPLTAALNDMACKLADRENDLRAANRHLEELASMDALSGLANRRGFDARLTAEWQRAGKLKRPIALLMVDVDHFKLFNDRYGHVEGDVCLRRLGKLLMDVATGPDDLPARYGGEEFALLLPGADIERALAIAEQLRRAVEELCVAHSASPLGQVTTSIGAASLVPGVGDDAERLVEAADIGLYAAKRRGRNAVVAHGAVLLAEAS